MNFGHHENITYLQNRLAILLVIILGFFFMVLGRLYFLQVWRADYYTKLSQQVLVRREEVMAQRGKVLDRHGHVLADDELYNELLLVPQYATPLSVVKKSAKNIFGLSDQDFEQALQKSRTQPSFWPVLLMTNISAEQASIYQMKLLPEYSLAPYSLAGIVLRQSLLRHYNYPEAFSHVLGYLREVDPEFLAKYQDAHDVTVDQGDYVGAAGIEYAYNHSLKGTDGILGHVVDARGIEAQLDGQDTEEIFFDEKTARYFPLEQHKVTNEDLAVLKQQASFEAVPGATLKTTLDYATQMTAYQAIMSTGTNPKGAAVALNPETGEILALVSVPGYNANRLIKNLDKEYWQKLNQSSEKFLFNRAIQAMYPPASTYKTVVLAAAIHENVIQPKTYSVNCSGSLRFGNRTFKCWKPGGHGRVNAITGLAQSCDVFFYKLGLLLGPEKIAKYAKMFGLNQKTGIEIPFEKSGLIPTAQWKKNIYQQDWVESETLSVAIGQSYNLTTTLQNAVMAGLVANGGYRVTPHLTLAQKPREATPLVDSEALSYVRQGMIEVVHGFGTATKLKNNPFKIAGKTGTAQVVGHDSKTKRSVHTENHALFIGFAPYDKPQIAFAVIVENGQGGSKMAAPVAEKMVRAYFTGQIQ